MKKILFVLVLIFTTQQVLSQELPISDKTGEVLYESVVSVDGASSEELYIRATEWFAKRFNSANDVIQMQDKEAGKIIGKGAFRIKKGLYVVGSQVHYTISIFAKEGRYKYAITDIYHEANKDYPRNRGGSLSNEKPDCGHQRILKKVWRKIKSATHQYCTALSKDITLYMSETNNEDDDW